MSSTPKSKSEPELDFSSALAKAVAIVNKSAARVREIEEINAIKAFSFNGEAKYQPGLQHAASHDVGNLSIGRVQVQSEDPHKWFEARYPNIFEKYPLTVSTEEQVAAWSLNPMQFWQNQLNFAVWCATTGCGVSVEDHLNAADGFLRSLYRFHAYYQIRRILKEIKAPLP